MTKIVMKKIAVVLFSCGVGLLAGTMAATPVIAVLNYVATDGPYFAAPLVAFGFLALPLGVLLLPIQSSVVAYEVIARRALGNSLLLLGAIGGLAVGIVWYVALTSSLSSSWLLLAMCGIGLLQALSVFLCHWIVHKLRLADVEQK